MASVRLQYIAEMASLRDELRKNTSLTKKEVQAQLSEINKTFLALGKTGDAANAAGNKAAAGFNKARGEVGNFNAQVFDVGTQLAGGTNPLLILAQQGPQFAQVMASSGDAVKLVKTSLVSLAGSIGPVVVVLGSMYVGWRALNEEQDRAEAIAQDVADQYQALGPILDDTRAKTVELAVATGQLTEEQGRQFAAGTEALRSFNAATEETRKKIADNQAQMQSWRTTLVDMGEAVMGSTVLFTIGARALDGVTTSTAELEQEQAALRGTLTPALEALRANVTVTNELAAAEERNARSSRAATDATRERERAAKELQRTLEELAGIEQARRDASLSATGQEEVRAERELDQIAAIAAAHADNAEVQAAASAASLAVAEESAARIAEMRTAEEAAKFEAIRRQFEADAVYAEEQKRLAAEVAAEKLAQDHAYADAQSSILGAVASLSQTLAEGQVEGNREAAMMLFGIAKAAGLAQVAVDTALAVSKVNAAWAAVPPVAAALSAGAIAVGVAQAAAIAAQQPAFHVGGVIGGSGGPDETTARVLPGEAVLSRAAVARIGERGVSEANRGIGGGGQSFTLLAQYGHRTLDAVTYDAIQRPGSPLRVATRAGRRKPGRRS